MSKAQCIYVSLLRRVFVALVMLKNVFIEIIFVSVLFQLTNKNGAIRSDAIVHVVNG
jgi:hypothetical protein